jgi:hypothetical protein
MPIGSFRGAVRLVSPGFSLKVGSLPKGRLPPCLPDGTIKPGCRTDQKRSDHQTRPSNDLAMRFRNTRATCT